VSNPGTSSREAATVASMTALNPRFIVGTRSLTTACSTGSSAHVRIVVSPSVSLATSSTVTSTHASAVGSTGSSTSRTVSAASTNVRGSLVNCTTPPPRSVKFRHVRVRPYVRAVTGSLGSSGAWSPSAATFQRSFGPSASSRSTR